MKNNCNDLRVVKTRQNIRNAVLELMEEKPISAITITEISKKALINRKTFYRHFESVYDVMADIERDILDTMVSLLSRNNSSCLEIGVVLRYIGTTIEMNKDVFCKIIKLSPDYIYSSRMYELLHKTTKVALKSVVNTSDKDKTDIMTQFVISGVLSVYSKWLESGCNKNIDVIVESTRRLTYGCLVQFIPEQKLNNMELY